MNDKTAEFPAIYRNILNNMSGICLLLDFLRFVILLPLLVLVDLLARHSVYPMIDRCVPHMFKLFTALIHIVTFCAFFCAGFTLFYCFLIHCHILAFSLYTSYLPRSLSHVVTNFLWRDCRFYAFYLFTSQCSLFYVVGKLHAMRRGQRHCPEEA